MANYEALFQNALDLMQSGRDYAGACTLWDRALQAIDGDDEECYLEASVVCLNKALCLMEMGSFADSAALCHSLLEDEAHPIDPAGDLGQQILGVLVDCYMSQGDLGRARAVSERAFLALEAETEKDEGELCLPATLLGMAEKRARLAREMGKPDDAEEALALALEQVPDPRREPTLDAEDRLELAVTRAKLLQLRAHNRYEGQAAELAGLDLEDALSLYESVLGTDHPTTEETRELLRQVSGTL